MQTSDLIALVAFLVSVLAAIYARRSSNEARRANRIAIHAGRISVFKGLLALRFEFSAHGEGIKAEVIFAFHDDVVVQAEFFFGAQIHAALEALAKDLSELEETHRRFDYDAPQAERAPLAEKMATLKKRCRESLQSIEASMRAELRKVARELT